MARILVACEWSGIVRDAFNAQGHDAISCDILMTESDGPHYKGDVRDILYDQWDMVIAHPPCTRLTNSGVRWLHERDLWDELDEAAEFFKLFLDHPCEYVAVENPVPHKYAVERIGRNYDQKIQPWQFGHPETKGTCWWLKNLPPLEPTNIITDKREHKMHMMPDTKNRSKLRSKFYTGVASAMANQWGKVFH